jgi:hypothetical protein
MPFGIALGCIAALFGIAHEVRPRRCARCFCARCFSRPVTIGAPSPE